MTDEERQKLCEALRGSWPGALSKMMSDAADEIERLALNERRFEGLAGILRQEIKRLAALTQSDAEPVAWQDVDLAGVNITGLEPPRPDTSAELMEAAETELNKIRDCMLNDRSYYDGLIDFAGDIERVAAMLRALAADRSGK